jgi:AcrR family transcriptional regulator
MARPSQITEKRKELLPVVAQAFAEMGYRRTTTADLARRCGVRENILYRLWPDKKAMFIAAIDYVFDLSVETWAKLLAQPAKRQSGARKLLEHEASHHGELGLYRIVFAGLSETDDPEIREALARMYDHFQKFIRDQIEQHRAASEACDGAKVASTSAAWAVIGLGTVANIGRELRLMDDSDRRRLMEQAGRCLLDAGGEKKGD